MTEYFGKIWININSVNSEHFEYLIFTFRLKYSRLNYSNDHEMNDIIT